MFSIRLVTADHYMGLPIPGLDVEYSEFRGADVKQVPVIRIFGSSITGKKTCLHVHGVFPYICIPCDGVGNHEKLMYQIASSLDKALNISLGKTSSTAQHVYKVVLVSGVPFYGFHLKEHQYFKIYFYNPLMIKRAVELLQNGAILNKVYQPHEAHVPYILQFMIDYNLYGMNLVDLENIRVRRDPENPELLECFPQDILLPLKIRKISTCELEIDTTADDIINRKAITAKLVVNPGLAAIWEDEKQRRREEGRSSQITPQASQSCPRTSSTDSEIFFKQRLREQLLALNLQQSGSSSLTPEEIRNPYPAETPEGSSILEASFVDRHVQSSGSSLHVKSQANVSDNDTTLVDEDLVLSLSQSQSDRPPSAQDSLIFDSEDLELAAVLHHLEQNADVDDDSVLGSQVHQESVQDNHSEDEDDHQILSQALVGVAELEDEHKLENKNESRSSGEESDDSLWEDTFWDNADNNIPQLDGTDDVPIKPRRKRYGMMGKSLEMKSTSQSSSKDVIKNTMTNAKVPYSFSSEVLCTNNDFLGLPLSSAEEIESLPDLICENNLIEANSLLLTETVTVAELIADNVLAVTESNSNVMLNCENYLLSNNDLGEDSGCDNSHTNIENISVLSPFRTSSTEMSIPYANPDLSVLDSKVDFNPSILDNFANVYDSSVLESLENVQDDGDSSALNLMLDDGASVDSDIANIEARTEATKDSYDIDNTVMCCNTCTSLCTSSGSLHDMRVNGTINRFEVVCDECEDYNESPLIGDPSFTAESGLSEGDDLQVVDTFMKNNSSYLWLNTEEDTESSKSSYLSELEQDLLSQYDPNPIQEITLNKVSDETGEQKFNSRSRRKSQSATRSPPLRRTTRSSVLRSSKNVAEKVSHGECSTKAGTSIESLSIKTEDCGDVSAISKQNMLTVDVDSVMPTAFSSLSIDFSPVEVKRIETLLWKGDIEEIIENNQISESSAKDKEKNRSTDVGSKVHKPKSVTRDLGLKTAKECACHRDKKSEKQSRTGYRYKKLVVKFSSFNNLKGRPLRASASDVKVEKNDSSGCDGEHEPKSMEKKMKKEKRKKLSLSYRRRRSMLKHNAPDTVNCSFKREGDVNTSASCVETSQSQDDSDSVRGSGDSKSQDDSGSVRDSQDSKSQDDSGSVKDSQDSNASEACEADVFEFSVKSKKENGRLCEISLSDSINSMKNHQSPTKAIQRLYDDQKQNSLAHDLRVRCNRSSIGAVEENSRNLTRKSGTNLKRLCPANCLSRSTDSFQQARRDRRTKRHLSRDILQHPEVSTSSDDKEKAKECMKSVVESVSFNGEATGEESVSLNGKDTGEDSISFNGEATLNAREKKYAQNVSPIEHTFSFNGYPIKPCYVRLERLKPKLVASKIIKSRSRKSQPVSAPKKSSGLMVSSSRSGQTDKSKHLAATEEPITPNHRRNQKRSDLINKSLSTPAPSGILEDNPDGVEGFITYSTIPKMSDKSSHSEKLDFADDVQNKIKIVDEPSIKRDSDPPFVTTTVSCVESGNVRKNGRFKVPDSENRLHEMVNSTEPQCHLNLHLPSDLQNNKNNSVEKKLTITEEEKLGDVTDNVTKTEKTTNKCLSSIDIEKNESFEPTQDNKSDCIVPSEDKRETEVCFMRNEEVCLLVPSSVEDNKEIIQSEKVKNEGIMKENSLPAPSALRENEFSLSNENETEYQTNIDLPVLSNLEKKVTRSKIVTKKSCLLVPAGEENQELRQSKNIESKFTGLPDQSSMVEGQEKLTKSRKLEIDLQRNTNVPQSEIVGTEGTAEERHSIVAPTLEREKKSKVDSKKAGIESVIGESHLPTSSAVDEDKGVVQSANSRLQNLAAEDNTNGYFKDLQVSLNQVKPNADIVNTNVESKFCTSKELKHSAKDRPNGKLKERTKCDVKDKNKHLNKETTTNLQHKENKKHEGIAVENCGISCNTENEEKQDQDMIVIAKKNKKHILNSFNDLEKHNIHRLNGRAKKGLADPPTSLKAVENRSDSLLNGNTMNCVKSITLQQLNHEHRGSYKINSVKDEDVPSQLIVDLDESRNSKSIVHKDEKINRNCSSESQIVSVLLERIDISKIIFTDNLEVSCKRNNVPANIKGRRNSENMLPDFLGPKSTDSDSRTKNRPESKMLISDIEMKKNVFHDTSVNRSKRKLGASLLENKPDKKMKLSSVTTSENGSTNNNCFSLKEKVTINNESSLMMNQGDMNSSTEFIKEHVKSACDQDCDDSTAVTLDSASGKFKKLHDENVISGTSTFKDFDEVSNVDIKDEKFDAASKKGVPNNVEKYCFSEYTLNNEESEKDITLSDPLNSLNSSEKQMRVDIEVVNSRKTIQKQIYDQDNSSKLLQKLGSNEKDERKSNSELDSAFLKNSEEERHNEIAPVNSPSRRNCANEEISSTLQAHSLSETQNDMRSIFNSKEHTNKNDYRKSNLVVRTCESITHKSSQKKASHKCEINKSHKHDTAGKSEKIQRSKDVQENSKLSNSDKLFCEGNNRLQICLTDLAHHQKECSRETAGNERNLGREKTSSQKYSTTVSSKNERTSTGKAAVKKRHSSREKSDDGKHSEREVVNNNTHSSRETVDKKRPEEQRNSVRETTGKSQSITEKPDDQRLSNRDATEKKRESSREGSKDQKNTVRDRTEKMQSGTEELCNQKVSNRDKADKRQSSRERSVDKKNSVRDINKEKSLSSRERSDDHRHSIIDTTDKKRQSSKERSDYQNLSSRERADKNRRSSLERSDDSSRDTSHEKWLCSREKSDSQRRSSTETADKKRESRKESSDDRKSQRRSSTETADKKRESRKESSDDRKHSSRHTSHEERQSSTKKSNDHRRSSTETSVKRRSSTESSDGQKHLSRGTFDEKSESSRERSDGHSDRHTAVTQRHSSREKSDSCSSRDGFDGNGQSRREKSVDQRVENQRHSTIETADNNILSNRETANEKRGLSDEKGDENKHLSRERMKAEEKHNEKNQDQSSQQGKICTTEAKQDVKKKKNIFLQEQLIFDLSIIKKTSRKCTEKSLSLHKQGDKAESSKNLVEKVHKNCSNHVRLNGGNVDSGMPSTSSNDQNNSQTIITFQKQPNCGNTNPTVKLNDMKNYRKFENKSKELKSLEKNMPFQNRSSSKTQENKDENVCSKSIKPKGCSSLKHQKIVAEIKSDSEMINSKSEEKSILHTELKKDLDSKSSDARKSDSQTTISKKENSATEQKNSKDKINDHKYTENRHTNFSDKSCGNLKVTSSHNEVSLAIVKERNYNPHVCLKIPKLEDMNLDFHEKNQKEKQDDKIVTKLISTDNSVEDSAIKEKKHVSGQKSHKKHTTSRSQSDHRKHSRRKTCPVHIPINVLKNNPHLQKIIKPLTVPLVRLDHSTLKKYNVLLPRVPFNKKHSQRDIEKERISLKTSSEKDCNNSKDVKLLGQICTLDGQFDPSSSDDSLPLSSQKDAKCKNLKSSPASKKAKTQDNVQHSNQSKLRVASVHRTSSPKSSNLNRSPVSKKQEFLRESEDFRRTDLSQHQTSSPTKSPRSIYPALPIKIQKSPKRRHETTSDGQHKKLSKGDRLTRANKSSTKRDFRMLEVKKSRSCRSSSSDKQSDVSSDPCDPVRKRFKISDDPGCSAHVKTSGERSASQLGCAAKINPDASSNKDISNFCAPIKESPSSKDIRDLGLRKRNSSVNGEASLTDCTILDQSAYSLPANTFSHSGTKFNFIQSNIGSKNTVEEFDSGIYTEKSGEKSFYKSSVELKEVTRKHARKKLTFPVPQIANSVKGQDISCSSQQNSSNQFSICPEHFKYNESVNKNSPEDKGSGANDVADLTDMDNVPSSSKAIEIYDENVQNILNNSLDKNSMSQAKSICNISDSEVCYISEEPADSDEDPGIVSFYNETMIESPILQQKSSVKIKKLLRERNVNNASEFSPSSGETVQNSECVIKSIDHSPCYRIYTPKYKAPTRQEILNSLSEFNIPEYYHQEPFYGNALDVTDKKDVCNKSVKIPSNSVIDLQPFTSCLDNVKGIEVLRQSQLQEFLNFSQGASELNQVNINCAKSALASHREVIITPCKIPPSAKEVKAWLERKKHPQQDIQKYELEPEVNLKKIMVPLSPGQEVDSDDDMSLSLCSPATPRSLCLEHTPGSSAAQVHSTPDEALPLNILPSPSYTPIHENARKRTHLWRSLLKPSGKELMLNSPGSNASSSLPSIAEEKEDVNVTVLDEKSEPSAAIGNLPSCSRDNQQKDENTRMSTSASVDPQKPSTSKAPFEQLCIDNYHPQKTPKHARRSGSSCQIEECTPNNTYGFRMSLENLQDAKAVSLHQYLTTFIMEVHCQTRGDLKPDPDYDPIRAIFYTVINDVPNDSSTPKSETGIIAVRNLDGNVKLSPLGGADDKCVLSYVEDETSLLQTLVTVVKKWDPDILAGYEVETLSWGYLFERGYKLQMNLQNSLSRIPTDNLENQNVSEKRKQKAWMVSLTEEVKLAGRIILDVWRLMRHEVALMSYTFENMMFHILHQRVPLYSFRDLSFWWEHKTHLYRWICVDYYLLRVRGIVNLLDQLDLIGRTSELARLFGIQFLEVLSRGSQFRVESMMLRLAKPLNYVPVSPSIQQRAKMRAPESLPLIMEPNSRYYSDPVIVLDFQSLYPSIIIAYNYCFSTCLGRVEHLGQATPFKFGCTHLKVPPAQLLKLESDINISPCGVAFVKEGVRKGVLPRMLQEILDTRLMVKQSMKEHKSNKTLQRVLHSRQLGLKLIANVTYGYTSANFSGRMPCMEIGDSVVSKGRETLERAIHLVEATPRWGAQVVYGDTDSMFVLVAGKNREQAFKIGAEIAEAVTLDNPRPVKLKLEKVYQPCILQTKKRYVGYMYENPDQEKPVYEAKGIETVRRDGCPAVAKILEKSLRLVFESQDVSLVKSYVCRQFAKILQGRLNLQDLIFAREYRGMSGYRPGACVPALELTKRWMQTDKRAEPRQSERVPYVIVNGPPGVPLIRLVRSPHELVADPSLKPNATYYITKVIIPPLNRCFCLLGADVNSWYAEMPRKFTASVHATALAGSKKSTISHHFATMNCAVCNQLTTAGLCPSCQQDPQKTAVVLANKIQSLERTYHSIAKICQSCSGQHGALKCISLDCPIMFRRNQASHEMEQTTFLRSLQAQYLTF